jgi:hypothetical protein
LEEQKTKSKGIKKSIVIFFIITGFLFLGWQAFVALIKSAYVQTKIVHAATSILSDYLKTNVSIKSVDIEFFKTAVIEDIYVEDQHNDTLLYAKKLKVDIDLFSLSKNIISLSKVVLQDANFKLKYYEGEDDLNLQFIIDTFSSNDTSSSTSSWNFSVNQVELINSKFSYRNYDETPMPTGIDFENIQLSEINIKLNNIHLGADSISAFIHNASFTEKSGFKLINLTTLGSFSSTMISAKNFDLSTPNSHLTGTYLMTYDSLESFSNFLEEVVLHGDFNNAVLNLSDIAYFAPDLEGINKKIKVTGNVKGPVSNLRGKNLELVIDEETHLNCEASITGLPDIEETYMRIKIKELITNKEQIDKIPIPPFNANEFVHTTENFKWMGQIKFKGEISGFYNDFVAYGNFRTDLGNFFTDLSLKFNTKDGIPTYKGNLKMQNFNIGKFLQVKEVGNTSLSAEINGKGFSENDLKANLKGNINAIYIDKYNYHNITVDGDIANKLFKGLLKVNDEHLQLDFIGEINFQNKLPEFNFIADIEKVELAQLKIIDRDTSSLLKTKIEINLIGNSFDNIIGSVNISNTDYSELKHKYSLKSIYLNAEYINSTEKEITLKSDIADGKIKGVFNIAEIGPSLYYLFENTVTRNATHYQTHKKDKNGHKTFENFDLVLHLKNTQPITEIFYKDIEINENTHFTGSYNSETNYFRLNGTSPDLKLFGTDFKQFFINAKTENNVLTLSTGSARIQLSDSSWIDNFIIKTSTQKDSLNFYINWNNFKKTDNYSADISGHLYFNTLKNINGKLEKSNIVIADTLWYIDTQNALIIDTTNIAISNLALTTGHQSIRAFGNISQNPESPLKFNFENFLLENFNPLTASSGLNLKGTINGEGTITDAYESISFITDLKIDSLTINNEALGKASLNTIWNNRSEAIVVNGKLYRDTLTTFNISGNYYPSKKEENIDMTLYLNKFRLQLLNSFTEGIASNINGIATGKIALTGNISEPKLKGKINLQKTSFKIDYLNTTYTLSDDIIIENNWIGFDNIKIFDSKGNKAKATGTIFHKNFSDFNLDISIEADKFLCLNTNEFQNELYYGTAYVSGDVNINGTPEKLYFTINVKTEKGTQFFIPLGGSQDVTESSFITFITKDSTQLGINTANDINLDGIELKFELDVTPDAEVQLIFDPKIGDIMKGRGNGHITMDINTQGRFTMIGDYIIEDGEYLFTLINVINKKFKVEKGGSISWNGSPYNATANLKAIYPIKTSLYELGIDTNSKRRIPVECVMELTNDLMKPDIKLNINLPGNKEKESQVRNLINNETEMNRQFFALLTLNHFVPTQNSIVSSADPGYASVGSTTSSELLSNQLSNWLTQISKDFDLGLNYRLGDEISAQEVELALSTQLLNDRLSIDGNIGLQGNNPNTATQNTNNVVGDVNIEYKLTEDGRFRTRAFNRTNNNNLTYVNSLYTQGVGIFYRIDFDKPKDIWQRLFKKENAKRKEEE